MICTQQEADKVDPAGGARQNIAQAILASNKLQEHSTPLTDVIELNSTAPCNRRERLTPFEVKQMPKKWIWKTGTQTKTSDTNVQH